MSITPGDFQYVSGIVRQDAAIVLEKGKEYLVESRLAPLARKHGYASLETLVAALRSNNAASRALRYEIVEALTTNETSFFRDIEPFEALQKVILPELIAKRREKKALSIWCAASSTGQEPYSIAMLLRENFPELHSWKVTILATDIARDVLERARTGVYSQLEVNRGLPARYLVKYFTKRGSDWCIKDEVRNMIRYEELNLIKPLTTVPEVDLVFIRNVLIYFDIDTKKDILGKIRKVLRPDGYLFLGVAETTLNLDDKFERVALGKTSCYRKKP